MTDYTIRFSGRASLAVIGQWMCKLGVWKVVEQHVRIRQKIREHRPIDKLLDAFINIVAGGQGVVEINTRVRSDRALQRAFGRTACAEQSVVSDTLNASTPENVEQMRQALQELYRSHSRGYAHDYETTWQVLDVDMTGMPAGRQGEGVTKGYFSDKRNRRGRQLGRVVATLYDEIVVDKLYDGKTQLQSSLQSLVQRAEETLNLNQAQRKQTLLRVDGGGGKDEDINWLLERGYTVLVKVKNWKRAEKLARSVQSWHTDPKTGDRQVGWVEAPHTYLRPTRQLAVRTPKKNGEWRYWVIVSSLTDRQVAFLARLSHSQSLSSQQLLLATLYAYDLRSGGVETSNKGSKQGLGITKRNKRRFAAQEMLVLLAQLAYNLLTWVRCRLSPTKPCLQRFGPLRMVRDVFHIPGLIRYDAQGHILQVVLSDTHVLALPFLQAISPLLAQDEMALNLGQI
jgi:hypothetical protein